MARAGRKRKDGAKRHPNGTVPRRGEDRSVASYGRARDVIGLVTPAFIATPLGRKWYLGEATTEQRDAGIRWAEVDAEHKRLVLDAPKASAKTAKLDVPVAGGAGAARSHDAENDRATRRALKRYRSHHDVVFERGGPDAVKALDKLCVDEEALTYAEWLKAFEGLDALVELMRSGRKRRAA